MLDDGRFVVAFIGTPSIDDGADAHTRQGPTTLYLASSADGGATWDLSEVGDAANLDFPVLRAAGERLLVAYARVGEDGRPVPVLGVSPDAGATWAEPLALDEAVDGKPIPTVAIDAAGTAYAGWYRADADGVHEYRVARVGADSLTLLSGAIGNGQRDYTGLVGLDAGAYAVWVAGDWPTTTLTGARAT